MSEVKKITEAFSMQPESFYVGKNVGDYKNPINVHSIKGEEREINGEFRAFYVGYDSNGNVLFKFLAESVNVEYSAPQPETK